MRYLFLLLLTLQVVAQPADFVIKGADIYTVDASRSWAQAIAVRAGKIVYVGAGDSLDAFIGEKTRVLDLKGKMVLPGFHDSHVHPASSGREMMQCDLSRARSVKDVEQIIRAYSESHPDGGWVVGGGWLMTVFPEGQPSKELLDRILPHRPGYFASSDAHTVWLNSKALEVAGITAQTPDPPGGKIGRDPRGEPNGLVSEEAILLVSKFLPPSSADEDLQGLLLGLAHANSFGITSLIEANATEELVAAYQRAESESKLTARVVMALSSDARQGVEQIERLLEVRKKVEGPLLRATSVKVFADGVVEAHTAALLEPYLDEHHKGLTIWPEEIFEPFLVALDKAGFQIHVHAIGDRAIRNALDAFAQARKLNGDGDHRHHIAHLQLLSPLDIPRFRELGVVANFQPLWGYNDSFMRKLTIPVLGAERAKWLYPLRSFHDLGTVIVGGSDWSVTSINPLEAIQVGLTRTDPDDPSAEPLCPEQALELGDLIAAYTINGAYGMHQEKQTGSIEVGKWADLVVLEKNLFEVEPRQIGKVRVLMTLLGGEIVYRLEGSSGFNGP